MDADRLPAFEAAVFAHARPRTVIITTPNREYNVLFESLGSDKLRHPDHRFEWTRPEFEGWAKQLAERNGYIVEFDGIGPAQAEQGSPTQMGVFTQC
jgi:hypothetical protein